MLAGFNECDNLTGCVSCSNLSANDYFKVSCFTAFIVEVGDKVWQGAASMYHAKICHPEYAFFSI